eukprot:3834433-Prymnesium_polylepis.1
MTTHLVRPTAAQRPRCRGPAHASQSQRPQRLPPRRPRTQKQVTRSHKMPLQLTPPNPLVTNELHRG